MLQYILIWYFDADISYGTNSFLDAATDNAHDVDDLTSGQFALWNNGGLTVVSNPIVKLDRWANYYEVISRLNIFINNIDEANVLNEANRTRWKGEAHGLRAYFYLRLAKLYGGVPIILDQKRFILSTTILKFVRPHLTKWPVR